MVMAAIATHVFHWTSTNASLLGCSKMVESVNMYVDSQYLSEHFLHWFFVLPADFSGRRQAVQQSTVLAKR